MAAKSDLFELVKSLTKSEKRYFRMSASFYARNGGNRYLHLFDMIDRQEEYDEESIRREFGEKLGTEYFSETKYYLYNAILKSLHAAEAEGDVETRLAIALHHAKILFRKKLLRQCLKVLRRIRTEAVVYELWPTAVKAYQIEFQLLMDHRAEGFERVDPFIDDVARYGALWMETIDYWCTYARLLHMRNIVGIPRTPEEMRAYDEAAIEGERLHGCEPASTSAMVYHGFGTALRLEAQRDYRRALDTYCSLLPVVESSPYWGRSAPLAVAPILSCICLMSILAADIETFSRYHPMLLERTATSPESVHYKMHINARAFGIELLANIGEFDHAMAEARELERCLDAYLGAPNAALVAHCFLSLHSVHFGFEDHVRCIEYVNGILALDTNSLGRTPYMQARVLQLIDHFELGNFTLLESLLRSMHRYMVMNGVDFRSERAILSLVRRALRTAPGRDQEMLFRTFREEIEPLLDDPFELNFRFWRTIVCWIESRIERRPYAEVVREKFLKDYGSPMTGDAELSLDYQHSTL